MPLTLAPKPHSIVKECARCGVEKPITEFYFRADSDKDNPRPHSYCIVCTKFIAINPPLRKAKPSPAELVLPLLLQLGYPARILPHDEIEVYGCLRICVKKARPYTIKSFKNQSRVFFTQRQLAQEYDMVIVVSPNGAVTAYGWYDAWWFDDNTKKRYQSRGMGSGRMSLLTETIDALIKNKRIDIARQAAQHE